MKRVIIFFLLLIFLFSISFPYNLKEGKILKNNISAINEDLNINGTIYGDVTLINGNVILSGVVKGDIAVVNGDVFLKSNSSVDGNILIVAGDLKREKGAKISGSIFFFNTYKKAISLLLKNPIKYVFSYSYSLKDKHLISTFVISLAIFIITLFIVMFFPEKVDRGINYVKSKKWSFVKNSFFYYLLFLVLIFISILLCAIYIGVIFLLFLSVLYVVCLIFGRAVILVYVGSFFVRSRGKFILKLLIGSLFYIFLSFIPGLAILSHILLQVFGVGVSILTKLGKG